MDFVTFIQVFGFIMIFLYLIFGIDDTIWFILSMISSIIKKKNDRYSDLDFDKLRNTPPKMLAVSIAAWHEANVIGDVISNFMNTTDYPKSMYHLFVGVYPNDPETIEAVKAVSKTFPNVHAVINCKEGPTTKAQNINHVIHMIKKYEEEHCLRFASLTIHDSEDVIHTYELLATNYLIDKHDALQFPVFPIIQFPKFRNFFKQLTTATYADEFAENHFVSLIERRNVGAFVPCAGTGFAISRDQLDGFENGEVLPSESLTEDYLLSLTMYKRGISLYYVLNRLPRVMKNGKIRTDFITTRSMFPTTFKTAVRQKTRWTYGITMQSVSARDVFERNKISFLGRYSLYKDLKAKYVNLIPFLGYFASVYCIFALFLDIPPLYESGSVAAKMAVAVFAMMIIRILFRAYSLYNVYGMRSVFFGCLLPPLFPIRLIYGNIINFAATVRSFKMFIFGEKSSKSKEKKERKKEEKAARKNEKKKVAWAKTDHEFLTKEQLRAYRRMLGDVLITQGYLTAKQFENALKQADKEHGEKIGEYLIKSGTITEEQMIRALGHVKHIQFIPKSVAKKLNYSYAKSFDKKKLVRYKLLPLTLENDICIIGICNDTRDEDIERFKKEEKLEIRRMYMMESDIRKALKSSRNKKTRKVQDSKPDYRERNLSFEQAILVSMYSDKIGKPKEEVAKYMGLKAYENSSDAV